MSVKEARVVFTPSGRRGPLPIDTPVLDAARSLGVDLDTVRGITFYKHGETAGLGAEIEQAWFQDNFVGKKIFDGNELRSIQVVKGRVGDVFSNPADHTYAVDGISGASLTGRGGTDLLDEKLTIYEPYIRRVRAETAQVEVR